MPSYFKLRYNLSRASCTHKTEYYCQDDATGITIVHEYADGFLYLSPGVPPDKVGNRIFLVPPQAVPCARQEYDEAHARYQTAAARKKAEDDAIRALRKGMSRNAHAAEEAGAAEKETVSAPAPAHFLDDFTLVDTETTGLSPEKHRLLEVAAVRYKNWEPVAQLQLFVRFTEPVPQVITNLTSITSADVRSADPAKLVLSKLRQLAGDSVIVGHNVGFDRRMIEAERTRLGAMLPLSNRFFCTFELAKTRFAGPHKLGVLCQRFEIPVVGAHRALNDVLMTFELLCYMHRLEPITELDLVKQQGKNVPVKKIEAPAQTTLFAA